MAPAGREECMEIAPALYCSVTEGFEGLRHPKYKKINSYIQPPYCRKAIAELEKSLAPGLYNVATGGFVCCVPENTSWEPAQQAEKEWEKIEKSTRLSHLIHQELLEKKLFLKQNMGPGKYEIKDFLELRKMRPSSVRGLCSAGEERFRDVQFCVPGPGTYGNPYTVLEEKEKQQGSSLGIMDSKSKKSHLFPLNFNMGPGTYNMKDALEEFLNRVISKRGPYETFTEDRSKPILYGYFAAPKRLTDSGPFEFKDFTEELKSKHKTIYGKFTKGARYPRFRAEGPGPAAYNLRSFPVTKKCNVVPFCTSAKRSVHFVNDNPVGVGRYNIAKQMLDKTATCCKTSFSSKAGRYLSNLEQDKCLQRRIRATNVPLTDREFLVTPAKYSSAAKEATPSV